jgi:HTH-type transcriptional regulator/antitoxin HigA
MSFTPPKTFITNEAQHEAAINELIRLNQSPDADQLHAAIQALGNAIEAYEIAAGHEPEPPQTLRGILEVEMFKRRIKQRGLAELLEVSEPRLSEIMKGKREMNLDFIKRLYTKLSIPAETLLRLSA